MNALQKRKAVFLDRDGTINRDVGYPNSYGLIEIFPYSFKAIRLIREAGLLAVIITNQSGVGRGLIEEDTLLDIHARMDSEFARHGSSFDGIYYCPHYTLSNNPEYRQDCSCRKPNPGMGERAAAELDIDTAFSYMIGDKVEDILFGINIKAKPILVLSGFGQESLRKLENKDIHPAYVAQTLLDAARWIVKQEKQHGT
ncbi:MAG: HAD family hydrolase [Candidatus Aminicenantes bacterium]|jgi:D-glycero-D-manno-heptose 1,7-bisphosphate phosphatase